MWAAVDLLDQAENSCCRYLSRRPGESWGSNQKMILFFLVFETLLTRDKKVIIDRDFEAFGHARHRVPINADTTSFAEPTIIP